MSAAVYARPSPSPGLAQLHHDLGQQAGQSHEETKMTKRQCIDCKLIKPVGQFSSRGGSRSHQLRSYCKPCMTKRSRSWRERNPDYEERLRKRDPNYFKNQRTKE